MLLHAHLPLHRASSSSEGRFQGLVFHSESTECHADCQKRSVIANETLAWRALDNFPGLLLLRIQFYYFLKWGNSVWRVRREGVSCCRKVWLFSPCRLFTFADKRYLGPSRMVGMPYINSDIPQALSPARDCRASHVALVNTRRVRFRSGFVQLKYSTKWLVWECLQSITAPRSNTCVFCTDC